MDDPDPQFAFPGKTKGYEIHLRNLCHRWDDAIDKSTVEKF